MRIGLIGCGWIAETHLESLTALGEQVACVCDPDPAIKLLVPPDPRAC